VSPWEEVCLAAEQHDAGMASWDLEPTLNLDTGLPHSFMEMPLDAHLDVWSHAAERVLPQSRYAALLVSMHGTALYEMRDLDRLDAADASAVGEFMAERRAEQERLLASLDLARPQVQRNQRLVWTWDFMSLALCLDWPPAKASRVPDAEGEVDVSLEPAGEGRVVVDPWPFGTDSVRVHCEGRLLTNNYIDQEQMRSALAEAPWLTLERELIPGSPPG
jgi:hypothetical protein